MIKEIDVGGDSARFDIRNVDLFSLTLGAFVPVMSSAMLNANVNTMAVNGRKLIMGIVQANIDRQGKADPVWPREKDADSSSDEEDLDVASKCGSATEYFNALFDMEHYGTSAWNPHVDGELLSTLGKDAVVGKKIRAAGLDWCIALNIQDETPDFMPALISANFNPKLLVPGVFSGRDDTPLPIGPQSGASKSMFGDEAVVVVRKSGAAEVIKKKYLTLTVLYKGQGFDNAAREKQIKWLTPTGVVTPTGGEQQKGWTRTAKAVAVKKAPKQKRNQKESAANQPKTVSNAQRALLDEHENDDEFYGNADKDDRKKTESTKPLP